MPRIKRARSFSKEYGPVVLWREDLEAIVEVLSRANRTRILTDDYSFSDLVEAEEHFGIRPAFALLIESEAPYATIRFARFMTTLNVSSGDRAGELYQELDAILERTLRPLQFAYKLLWFLPATLSLTTLSFFVPPPAAIALGILNFVILMIYAHSGYISVRRHSVIHFDKRAKSPTFFERNGERLVLTFIGAGLGSAATYFVPKLLSKVWP